MAVPKSIILEYSSEKWVLGEIDYLNNRSLPERCYVFLDQAAYPKSERNRPKSERDRTESERDRDREKSELDRGELLRPFDVPDFLNNDTCTDLNGYFGCKGTYDEEENLESYSTWFRCLVKMVLEVDKSTQPSEQMTHEVKKTKQPAKDYRWYEMGFFTRWDHSGRCIVLCVDTPKKLPLILKKVLQNSPPDHKDPFAMHAPLIDQIVQLYDDSVWASRDPIRKIEKDRGVAEPDFKKMHEISRHAVHISEVLSATIEVIESVQRQQKAIYKSLPDIKKTDRERAQEYTSFQLQMLKSLKLRASSNYERLKSEITLAYNMIAQQDNMLARQDNNVMKSIGLLTMTFLPATFISALFSTTFFTFGENGWQASTMLWVYWVITIPVTLVVIVFWRYWLNGSISRLGKRLLRKSRSTPKETYPTESKGSPPPPTERRWRIRNAQHPGMEP